jgi:hypothetical protein
MSYLWAAEQAHPNLLVSVTFLKPTTKNRSRMVKGESSDFGALSSKIPPLTGIVKWFHNPDSLTLQGAEDDKGEHKSLNKYAFSRFDMSSVGC